MLVNYEIFEAQNKSKERISCLATSTMCSYCSLVKCECVCVCERERERERERDEFTDYAMPLTTVITEPVISVFHKQTHCKDT